jgi:hypothetical protein
VAIDPAGQVQLIPLGVLTPARRLDSRGNSGILLAMQAHRASKESYQIGCGHEGGQRCRSALWQTRGLIEFLDLFRHPLVFCAASR